MKLILFSITIAVMVYMAYQHCLATYIVRDSSTEHCRMIVLRWPLEYNLSQYVIDYLTKVEAEGWKYHCSEEKNTILIYRRAI